MKGVTGRTTTTTRQRLISIHTPMKGVTGTRSGFIPTGTLFQSTLPWREWQCRGYYPDLSRNFNPHSHEGSDKVTSVVYLCQISFQSTLPWREWQWHTMECKQTVLFQSTLPWREWQEQCQYTQSLESFQSTLPWREWQVTVTANQTAELFQSTLPWREWLFLPLPATSHPPISIHTPMKGVTFPICR